MRTSSFRHTLPLGLAFSALTLLGSSAWAQDPPGEIAPADSFETCLNGAAPTTENVPAVDISRLDHIPDDVFVMDTNPLWDEIVIDFDDRLSNQEILTFTRSMGLDAALNSPHSDDTNLFIARVDEGAVPFVKDCLSASAPDDFIEDIEENFEYRAFDFVPNDPLYQFQWNFQEVGAESAWELATGRDVVVAVIDTGVTVADDPSRGIAVGDDLRDVRSVAGYDFVDQSDFVYDGHGHGTHVAGTIAQSTNNGYGVAGLAYDASIMPLRVLNSRGFGSVADIADAIRFAADHGAHVINMSLGGPLPSLVMKRAVSYANKQGVTVIAAAGNAGKRAPSYPAAYSEVFAVAATQYDQHTTFYSQWGDFVDIAAPGGNTRVDQNGDGRPDGIMQETHPLGKTDQHEFAIYMGTSMASPHVAAAAAMVISTGVTNPDKVKEILQRTADQSMRQHYDAKEFQERYGAGQLRVDQAVRSAQTSQGTTRFGGALALLLLTTLGLRRRQLLDTNAKDLSIVSITSVTAAAGLFFLPLLLPVSGAFGRLTALLARPLAEIDTALLGLAAHQSPILASVAIPFVAYALLAGTKLGRAIAVGLAIGTAAFCLTEAYMMTSDVSWIPGMAGTLDRSWLLINGLLSLALGYLGLMKKQ